MLQELRARAMVFGGVRITLVFIVLHCDLLIIVCLFAGFFFVLSVHLLITTGIAKLSLI